MITLFNINQKLIVILVLGFQVMKAQSLSLKIGVGLFKSTTNLQAQQERGNVFNASLGYPHKFDFMSQQQFTIVEPRYFPVTGISLPLYLEYMTKNKFSYRVGVVIGENIGLGYQRSQIYNAIPTSTNLPLGFYTSATGTSYGNFVTRFPLLVTLNGLNMLHSTSKNALLLSPVIGLEFMSIIKASNSGQFSEPDPFFIVEPNGNLNYYNASFMLTNYKTRRLRQLNIFGSIGFGLRYFRKSKEICELVFSYRHNLNPFAVPFQYTLKIEGINNTNPATSLVYNSYNHQGNAYSITLNFPIQLKFLEKKLFRNTN